MDQQNPTLAKIPILDTGKLEQWQFRIQQYLQHEHYALWEVIEFRDSYEVPKDVVTTGLASDGTGKKKGRTVTLTTNDMQKRKNDTFGGNEATKKTKKNLLKQQYGNFKAEGLKTLEQTFNRLQVIVSHLEFMDIEIEKDDLNQKFLTSLPPEWLMHTIVWRNRSDLDTMSLDDLYNHLKVYESEVQKKLESNSQNMAFISSAKHSSINEEVNIASVSTASTNVSTASANIKVASISQDTACAYIASQSSRLPEAKTEEGKTTTDKENHALVAGEEALTEFALMAKTSAESEVFDNSLCSKAFESRANCIESLTKDLKLLKKEKGELETKQTSFQTASKDLYSLLESQRLNKNKERLGYSVVPPFLAQVYSPLKKDLSWTGLPEFADDTVTDYSRPSPAIETTDRSTKTKTAKVETAKPAVKYDAMYSKPSKSSNVRRYQRNLNNLKSHQLGVKRGRTCPTNSHKTISPRTNNIDDKGYWDSGCSMHMTGNISYLSDYDPFDGGYVSFGQGGCKITDKGTIKTVKLKFENVYFVKDLKYSLFSVS
nr:hypothetical protein [Tanacetum cinerariifolium]